jgi:polyphosphate kinase
MFISSADWMSRNLDQRCEVAVPIYDKEIQLQLKTILEIQLKSNFKTRILDATLSNTYKKRAIREKQIRAQDAIYDYLLNDKQTYLKQITTK